MMKIQQTGTSSCTTHHTSPWTRARMNAGIVGITLALTLVLSGCHPPSSDRELQAANGQTVHFDERAVHVCASGQPTDVFSVREGCRIAISEFANQMPERAFVYWALICGREPGECASLDHVRIREALAQGKLPPADVVIRRKVSENLCKSPDRVERSISGRDQRLQMCGIAIDAYAVAEPRDPQKAAELVTYGCATFGDCYVITRMQKRCQEEHVNCDVVAALPKTYDYAASRRLHDQLDAEDDSRNADVKEERREANAADDARREQEKADKEQSQAALIGALQSIASSGQTIAPTVYTPTPRSVPPRSANASLPVRSSEPVTSGGSGSSRAIPATTTGTSIAKGADCTNMNSAVSLSTSRPTGPGHCAGEITGMLTNHGSQALWCVFAFYNNGAKTKDGGGGTVQPGQTTGGEMAGIWSCGADTIRYACFPNAPDPYSCKVNW